MNLFAIGLALLWGLLVGLIVANRFTHSRNSSNTYRSRRNRYRGTSRYSITLGGDGGDWDGDGDGDGGGDGGGE